MPQTKVNGVALYYELEGSGEPLALVHGSWGDATNWRFVVPGLAESFRVLAYDRRGHSEASGPISREASTRTATTSLLCWKRSTWRPHMW